MPNILSFFTDWILCGRRQGRESAGNTDFAYGPSRRVSQDVAFFRQYAISILNTPRHKIEKKAAQNPARREESRGATRGSEHKSTVCFPEEHVLICHPTCFPDHQKKGKNGTFPRINSRFSRPSCISQNATRTRPARCVYLQNSGEPDPHPTPELPATFLKLRQKAASKQKPQFSDILSKQSAGP